LCTAKNIKYINFEGSPEFSTADYEDDVHLKWPAAMKFNKLVVNRLAADPQFCKQAQQQFKQ
jgi:hypothetical protein